MDLWQFSHGAWPAWIVLLGLAAAWQALHWLPTEKLVCSLAGAQEVKPALWQLSQLAEAIPATPCQAWWLAGLPVAFWPLWQLVQLPAATPAWLNAATGRHAELRWQLSQEADVAKWPAGLPAARTPLWQFWQLPGAIPVWFMRAPAKERVE